MEKDTIGITRGIIRLISGMLIAFFSLVVFSSVLKSPTMVIIGVIVGSIISFIAGYYYNAEIEDITDTYILLVQGIGKQIKQKVMIRDIQRIDIMYGSRHYADVTIKRTISANGKKLKPIKFGLNFLWFQCKHLTDKYNSSNWEMQIAYELSAVCDIYIREWGRFWEKPKKISREKLRELAEK